ncbi:hypothetical protein MFRU_004g00060 [Monilinia fructicola]|uniref:Uncharacterized protein n=1 Tax=Monilinia fructicola TaxID=38448 RepID=A0A5M9JL81_MONFR|nr:hypothetical protein EYC84_000822 [Monilinia fructicola]KAG4033498.1 hypothetical protein MFRU_004g00060 [Monilinia fructicola]
MDRYITVYEATLHKAPAYGYTTEQFNLIDNSHYERVLDHPAYQNIPFQERRWMSERWTWETLFPHESHLFPGIQPRWHGPPNYLGLPKHGPAFFTVPPHRMRTSTNRCCRFSDSSQRTGTNAPHVPIPNFNSNTPSPTRARIASHDTPLPSIEAVTPTPTPTPKPSHLHTLPRAIRPYRRRPPLQSQSRAQSTSREWTSGWSPISPQEETSNLNLIAQKGVASPVRVGIKRGRAEIDEMDGFDREDFLERVVKKMRA